MKLLHIRLGSAWVFLVAWGFAGCTNISAQRAELRQEAPPCCAALSDKRATPYQPRPFSVEVPEHGPIIEFPTGKSRFALVDLAGAGKPPQHLALASAGPPRRMFGTGPWEPVFFPAATFLDAEWQRLATIDNAEQGLRGCGVGASCTTKTLDVAVPPDARYLVIHTPERLVGAKQSSPTGAKAPPSVYSINGTLVSVGGGEMTDLTVGMSYGSVDILPVEFVDSP